MYLCKIYIYFVFVSLLGLFSCDPNEGKSPPPAKVYMVLKTTDLDTIERGIDAVPDNNGISIEWNLLPDPDVESYNIYRKAVGDKIFDHLINIRVENVISSFDTVFSYIDNDSISLNTPGEYNYYYVTAINKDGIEGVNSDTVKYSLYSKPAIEDIDDINVNDQLLLRWRYQGGNIPDYYIIRIETLVFEELLWVRKLQTTDYWADQEMDWSSVDNPPVYQSNTTYKLRIDVVGTDPLFSGSESNWKTFFVN